MNYFAHGWQYVDRPYFLAGTAIPDWLNVVNRRVRVRSRQASLFLDDADPLVAEVAAGVLQHCQDDSWFHQTLAFVETSLELGKIVRSALPHDEGFRPHFLGHILVEMLLDAVLIRQNPDQLRAYYLAIEQLDPLVIERAIRQMAGGQCEFARFLPLFCRERFLWDYLDDEKLLVRLNQVMRRVDLPVLPASFGQVLPEARQLVERRGAELLARTNGGPNFFELRKRGELV